VSNNQAKAVVSAISRKVSSLFGWAYKNLFAGFVIAKNQELFGKNTRWNEVGKFVYLLFRIL
jgi:hypothetical protein